MGDGDGMPDGEDSDLNSLFGTLPDFQQNNMSKPKPKKTKPKSSTRAGGSARKDTVAVSLPLSHEK